MNPNPRIVSLVSLFTLLSIIPAFAGGHGGWNNGHSIPAHATPGDPVGPILTTDGLPLNGNAQTVLGQYIRWVTKTDPGILTSGTPTTLQLPEGLWMNPNLGGGSSGLVVTVVPALNGESASFMIRTALDTDPPSDDVGSIWVNPNLSGLFMTGSFGANNVMIGNGNNWGSGTNVPYEIDEIKLGATFADVTPIPETTSVPDQQAIGSDVIGTTSVPDVAPVPEPATLGILTLGGAMLAMVGSRKRKQSV